MAKLVSIIGSAGRKGDNKKMTPELYTLMKDKAIEVITGTFKLNMKKVHLVSGGAAWADHIAVDLFLLDEVSSLTLHLPAKLEDSPRPHFYDNGETRDNPGQVANVLHQKFSEKIGDDSLKQLYSATVAGAVPMIHNGFRARNSFVAKSDYLVAFTWNSGNCPKKGSGTNITWQMCTGKKHHVDLDTLFSPEKSRKKMKISEFFPRKSPVQNSELSEPHTQSLPDDFKFAEACSQLSSQSSSLASPDLTDSEEPPMNLKSYSQPTTVNPHNATCGSRKRKRTHF